MTAGDVLATKRALPDAVRIKRKRGQDPLKGLLVNPQTKRSRTDQYVFKLAGTFEKEPAESANVLLQEDVDMKEVLASPKRVFHFRKEQKEHQKDQKEHLKRDLKDMNSVVDQAVDQVNDQEPKSKVKAKAKAKAVHSEPELPESNVLNEMVEEYLQSEAPANDHEIEDYVYDIYYREAYNPSKWDNSNLGVIVIDSDDEFQLDQEEAEDSDVGSDDDDSNAEDFYRNDYPEDEDAYSSLDEDTRGLREGLEYLGIEDDIYGVHDADEAEESWSEDENFEQYRDRILRDLEDKIAEAGSES